MTRRIDAMTPPAAKYKQNIMARNDVRYIYMAQGIAALHAEHTHKPLVFHMYVHILNKPRPSRTMIEATSEYIET
jgi:mannitol/fructose-specific phosphotransferase system IIA component